MRNPIHLALACLALCASVPSEAQEARPFTIICQVTLPDGRPGVGAIVTATGQAGFMVKFIADDMGRVEISNVGRGRYELTASNPSAPEQFADPFEVELGRNSPNRVSVSIFLRNTAARAGQDGRPRIVSVAEAAQDVPKPARKAFDQAVKNRDEKRYKEALEAFGHAVELFPDYFQAVSERGHLLIAMGRAPEAAADFSRALELNPHYGPALRGSGICRFQQGKYAEAVLELQRAADAEPGNATNYLFMGTAQVALDQREQARASLQKALSIDAGGAARAHVYLANLSIKEDKPQEALSELEAYFAVVPNPPDKEKLLAIETQLRSALRR